MRIPWYIYAPLSLLVTFGTLFYYIKDIDSVTPPSPETTAHSISKWRQDNPSIRHTQLSDIPPAPPKEQPTPQPKPPQPQPAPQPEPKPQPVVKIPETSPALDSLVQLNLTTQQLSSYAELTLKSDKPQLARIAYERIIDTASDATTEDRKTAATSILKLLPQTPLWNPDPTIRHPFTINLTLNKQHTKKAEETISELKKLIFDSSDGTLEPTITITSTDAPLSSLNIGKDTPLVTFKLDTPADIDTKIPAALYYSIRHRNNNSQKLTNIPAMPTNITPKQALQTYITRLAWVNAAK